MGDVCPVPTMSCTNIFAVEQEQDIESRQSTN